MKNPGDYPLFVQGDRTLLLEVDHPRFAQARESLLSFAELIKSPDHLHTYRLTPLSIWNARSAGVSAEWIVRTLHEFSKYEVPPHIEQLVSDYASRYGKLRMTRNGDELILGAEEVILAEEIWSQESIWKFLGNRINSKNFSCRSENRGHLKQALIKVGYPVVDLAGFIPGELLEISLKGVCRNGVFRLRPYQEEAVDIFHASGSVRGGSGVVVLPCGAGKTVVGIGITAAIGNSTLILTTSTTAVRQWKEEILDKTSLHEDQIGEYTGFEKEIRPITVTTYQILTYRKSKTEEFSHFKLFDKRNWGLVIYDEVHLLPAPVFQMTAEIQAKRRLGLTATLVREDGREDDVFALIGPKKVDIPWKIMEEQGWIAKAVCKEIRVRMSEKERMNYAVAPRRFKFRVASENSRKIDMVREVLKKHSSESVLVIGTYVEHLNSLAMELEAEIITGKTPQKKRDFIFEDFRAGRLKILFVSKVANFAVDLPEASCAIQVSGTFGSRQEEAQRLGRILRPKKENRQVYFYTLVTQNTLEQDFALKRQLFLCEQGYRYEIFDEEEWDNAMEIKKEEIFHA